MNASAPLRLAALVALLGASSPAPAQEWAWALRAGGAGADFGDSVALDAAGNAYVVGYFQGAAAFGPFTLTSAGGWDAYVAKVSPEGEVVWARRIGGTGTEDRARGVAVDATGDIFVAGRFQGTATVGTFTLTSAGSHDVFVARYTADGEALWARRAGGPGSDFGFSVATDEAGNAYVAGDFQQTAGFGGHTLTSAGDWDVFLARYAPDGEVLWARGGGGPGADIGVRSDTDAEGTTFVVGRFEGTADFGTGPLVSAGAWDIYLAKYAPGGEVLWVRGAGGPAFDQGIGVAVDGAGGAYAGGRFGGTAGFGAHALTSAGGSDVFLARYAPDGEVLWARRAGGPGEDWSYGVASDPQGNAHLTGYFAGTADFGPLTLTSAGDLDVFLARYSPTGEAMWAQRAGGAGSDTGYDLAAGTEGDVTLVGDFAGTASFGPHTLTSAGSADAFVARFSTGDVGTEEGPPDVPLTLSAVRPNPVGGIGTFELTVREGQHARVELLDALGRRIAVLFEGAVVAGAPHAVALDASALAPGVYAVHVIGEGAFTATRWMLVVR